MNKKQFLNSKISDFSKAYSGKRDYCRCGCGGRYVYTSFSKNEKNNDKLFSKWLEKAKEIVKVCDDKDIEYGNTYIDIKTLETQNCVDRSLTFYFDELK